MGRQWVRGSAKFVLSCGVAAGVVGVSAHAVNDDLTIFSGFLELNAGTDIGTGGDGSIVVFPSYYSMKPFETPTAELDLAITTNHSVSELDFTLVPDINLVSNGFSDGDIVKFTSTTDTMPTGLGLGTTYHVVNVAADTFQLATVPGGPAIPWGDGGFGVHSFTRTTGKFYADDNDDLFTWAPGQDHVQQFTITGDVDSEDGTSLAWRTHNEEPAFFSRTGDARNQPGTRVWAGAWATNADPALPGPISTIPEVDFPYQVLGGGGRLIAYTDSALGETIPLETIYHYQECFDPSVAFRTKVTNRGSSRTGNFRTLAITDSWVAFAGSANNNQDNADGNYEIHLWTRSQYLASLEADGVLNNSGVQQITHTNSGDCWAPSVSINGDVAFVSDADITGDNADGSSEIFVYKRKRGEIKQITSISPARYVDSPCWGDNGRKVVFEGDADPTGDNPDLSIEVFAWNGSKVKQVTMGTTGDSWAPSMDPYGGTIAFLTTADLPNVVYGGVPRPEVVVTSWPKRKYRQVTQVNDSETNYMPRVTRNRVGRVQVTFVSTSNLDGRNNNNNSRIYRATVK